MYCEYQWEGNSQIRSPPPSEDRELSICNIFVVMTIVVWGFVIHKRHISLHFSKRIFLVISPRAHCSQRSCYWNESANNYVDSFLSSSPPRNCDHIRDYSLARSFLLCSSSLFSFEESDAIEKELSNTKELARVVQRRLAYLKSE